MIVKNTNINFTNYYNILNFLGDTLKNHSSIAYVSQGPILDIDNFSFPSYPFANILINQINVLGKVSTYSVNIIVGDKVKELNNLSENDTPQIIDFYGTDDEVDVFANTLGILNDVLNFIENGTTAFTIEGGITMNPFSNKFKNGISGFSADFNLSTFNNRNFCS